MEYPFRVETKKIIHLVDTHYYQRSDSGAEVRPDIATWLAETAQARYTHRYEIMEPMDRIKYGHQRQSVFYFESEDDALYFKLAVL